MLSFTAFRKRCLQPKYRTVVCAEDMSQKELNQFQFTTSLPNIRMPLSLNSDKMMLIV